MVRSPPTPTFAAPSRSTCRQDPCASAGLEQVWQYPSSETKVGLLTLEAQSVGAIATTCDRLRALLCNAMSYVPLDPEKLPKGIVSGKALEALRTRQINRCDTLRDDVADGWLAPALAMLLLVSERPPSTLKTST